MIFEAMGSSENRTPRLYLLLFMCAVAGLLTSLYLVYEDFAPSGDRACDLGQLVSCSKVLDSDYSWLFGVPVAVFGVVSDVRVLAWFRLFVSSIWTVSNAAFFRSFLSRLPVSSSSSSSSSSSFSF